MSTMYHIDSYPYWTYPAPCSRSLERSVADAKALARLWGDKVTRVAVVDDRGKTRFAMRRNALGWRRCKSEEERG